MTNIILGIGTLVVGFIILLILFLKAKGERSDFKLEDAITFDALVNVIKRQLNDFIDDQPLSSASDEEFTQSLRRMAKIRDALNDCVYGLDAPKTIVKDLIRKKLAELLKTPEEICKLINFSGNYIEPRIKFEILMYRYKKIFKASALSAMIREFDLDRDRYIIEDGTKRSYAIEVDDIDLIYAKKVESLTYDEMLDIMTVLVYQKYKGFGILDTLNEMDINGYNCGTSGAIMDHLRSPEQKTDWKAPRSVWLYYEGKFLHLRFLSFGTESELLRVINLMIRWNRPGPLTEKRGAIVNTMSNKSRIMAMRPPLSEYPAVFVRKFTLSNVTTEGLIFRPKSKNLRLSEKQWAELELNSRILPHEFTEMRNRGFNDMYSELSSVLMRGVNIPGFVKNGHIAVLMMSYLMIGQVTTAFTGRQGSGKTTMMSTMPRYMDAAHPIRILEMAFELYLRELYTERNILTIQETETVSASKGQDFLKKSDAAISLAGEVATDEVAVRMIQFALIASLYTIFSHHANTTEGLVSGMRNHIVAAGGFDNTYVAELQVLEVLRVDVHLDYTSEGYRYVERITEIIKIPESQDYPEIDPKNVELSRAKMEREFYYRSTDRKTFYTRDILIYDKEKHTYVTKNMPSALLLEHMLGRMSASDKEAFSAFLLDNWEGAPE